MTVIISWKWAQRHRFFERKMKNYDCSAVQWSSLTRYNQVLWESTRRKIIGSIVILNFALKKSLSRKLNDFVKTCYRLHCKEISCEKEQITCKETDAHCVSIRFSTKTKIRLKKKGNWREWKWNIPVEINSRNIFKTRNRRRRVPCNVQTSHTSYDSVESFSSGQVFLLSVFLLPEQFSFLISGLS